MARFLFVVAPFVMIFAVAPVEAQSGDSNSTTQPITSVTGPGQAVPEPAPLCEGAVACQYAEQNLLPNIYRFQSLEVCGANCTTQYWVSALQGGQQFLEIDPVRGGAVLAVNRSNAADTRPPVRVVMPQYAPSDPACCPSAYTDTTYLWDPASTSLVPVNVTSTPADQFAGWDQVRQELAAQGWLVTTV